MATHASGSGKLLGQILPRKAELGKSSKISKKAQRPELGRG